MTSGRQAVRVMTWNVWGRFGEWEKRLPIIADTLGNVRPDIVALQEVWSESRDGGSGQVKFLADTLGYDYHSFMITDRGDYCSGNALLARWPMEVRGQEFLPMGLDANKDSRAAVYALVSSPFGQIPVISSHLSWQRNWSDVRQLQVQALVVLATRLASSLWPPILMGDFNSDPDSDEIRLLTGRCSIPHDWVVFQDAWEQAGTGSTGFTWTPENGYYSSRKGMTLAAMPWLRRRIDYIFVGLPDERPNTLMPVQIERCWLEGNAGSKELEGSDHYAVVADLLPDDHAR